jgi:hypothetical protein
MIIYNKNKAGCSNKIMSQIQLIRIDLFNQNLLLF